MILGNYRTLMIGCTLAKIYDSIMEREIDNYTEAQGQQAIGWQGGFGDIIPL